MAGGNFTTQDKILPSAYINVVGSGNREIAAGGIGTVAIPLQLDYGKEGGFVEVSRLSDSYALFGAAMNDESLRRVELALQNASSVIVTNVRTGGAKATVTIDGTVFTAKNPGIGGNNIGIAVTTETYNIRVVTYFGNRRVDTQTIPIDQGILGLTGNDYVDVDTSNSTDLTDTAITKLTGGLNGTASVQNYIEYLEDLREFDFYVLADTTGDVTIRRLFEEYVLNERLNGNYIVLVTSEDTESRADHEAISCVLNGFTIGTKEYSKEDAVSFIAGAMAGAEIGQSLTYKEVPDATGTNATSIEEQTQAIIKGGIQFINSHKRVVVLNDVNTLTGYTDDKPKYFSKNVITRTIDYLTRNVKYNFETRFIGKVKNNDDGRGLFKQDVIEVLATLLEAGAIEQYKEEDIIVLEGATKDSVTVDLGITVTDAIEKLYLTINVG